MTSAGFGRERRLTESSDYSRVFANASRSADRYFTVLSRPSTSSGPRLGLTISRRAAKKAVDRNRLKRLARETFRQLQLPALDFVLIAKPAATAADRATLRQSLEAHFRRLAHEAHGKT